MMITFKTIEDYIEVIAGTRDPATNKLTQTWIAEPIVSLARYDVNVISSMSDQIAQNIGFTEKQADLATKIVLKYNRQLAAKGIDVTPANSPAYRIPLRKMDYSKSVTLDEDTIRLRFPFDSKLIEQVKDFAKTSQGHFKWESSSKVWKSALTEYNLNWIYNFAKIHNFTIDNEVQKLYDTLLEVEQVPFKIELSFNDGKLEFCNAPSSMTEYVKDNIGELSMDNFYKLIDYAPIIGYTVDPAMLDAIVSNNGGKFLQFISNRELKINPAHTESIDFDMESLVQYAIATNRFPIVVYEPDLGNKLFSKISQHFAESEVITLGMTAKDIPDLGAYKVVHTAKAIKSLKIPLLVSGAGMMFGGEKQVMQQNAEKVVYIAADVYSPANKNKKVLNLSG